MKARARARGTRHATCPSVRARPRVAPPRGQRDATTACLVRAPRFPRTHDGCGAVLPLCSARSNRRISSARRLLCRRQRAARVRLRRTAEHSAPCLIDSLLLFHSNPRVTASGRRLPLTTVQVPLRCVGIHSFIHTICATMLIWIVSQIPRLYRNNQPIVGGVAWGEPSVRVGT